MALCSFNDIGNFLSAHEKADDSATFRVDLPPNDVLVREKIFRKDGDMFAFTRKGLEAFIARRFGCKDEPIHSSNFCSFGTVNGRELHYCAAPKPNFYSMHGPETSVIIGSNDADVPHDWRGHAALLSNMFTVRDGAIVTVKSGMKQIFPATGEPRKPRGAKKDNVRRCCWLEFLCDHITHLQMKYGVMKTPSQRYPVSLATALRNVCASDFARPKPGAILQWFKTKKSVTITSDRTVRRDIASFAAFRPGVDAYDKRDALIAAVWKKIDDPKFALDPATLVKITTAMSLIKAPHPGRYADVSASGKAAFEDDADSTGRNPSRTIAVGHGIDIDKDLRG